EFAPVTVHIAAGIGAGLPRPGVVGLHHLARLLEAPCIDVAKRDDLGVRLAKETGEVRMHRLAARADDAHRNPPGGGDGSAPATETSRRNDPRCRHGSGRAEESPEKRAAVRAMGHAPTLPTNDAGGQWVRSPSFTLVRMR